MQVLLKPEGKLFKKKEKEKRDDTGRKGCMKSQTGF